MKRTWQRTFPQTLSPLQEIVANNQKWSIILAKLILNQNFKQGFAANSNKHIINNSFLSPFPSLPLKMKKDQIIPVK